MPEKPVPTEGEQSLEDAQQAAPLLASGVSDEASLNNRGVTADSPNYQHAYEQLGSIEETQRHQVATQVGRLVELGVQSEAKLPEDHQGEFTTDLSKECIERIGKYFSGAYDSSKTEDEVWSEAINFAIDGGYEMQDYEGQAAALMMSRLAGIHLSDGQLIDCLEGSRMYTGIAAWSVETSQYEPISVDETELARRMIDTDPKNFAENISAFSSLPGELVNDLIDKFPYELASNLSVFENPDYNLLAHELLKRGYTPALERNLEDFRHLDDTVFNALVASGGLSRVASVAASPSSFENPDYQRIADELNKIDKGLHIGLLAKNLGDFKSLNNETAQLLFNYDPSRVIANRGAFADLTIEQIADATVERYTSAIFNNIDYFTNDERGYLAQRIMNAGTAYAVKLIQQLEDFKDTTLDEGALVNLFVDYKPEVLLNNLENFTNPDSERIVEAALEQKLFSQVAVNLPKLSDLKLDVAQTLIEQDNPGIYVVMAQYANAFHSPTEVLGLIPEHVWSDSDFADAVVENIAKYNLTPDALNDALTKCAQNYSTAQKIKQLDLSGMGLKQEAIDTLLNYITTIKPEASGVASKNPFASESGSIDRATLTKPGTNIHALGSKISKLLREAKKDTDHPFNHLSHLVDSYYKILTRRTQERADYADTLGESPESPTNSMHTTYRRLAADFIAMNLITDETLDPTLADTSRINWERLDAKLGNALDEANQKFLDVLRTDVPYYDKLFTEWDAKRLGQKDFQEVFLGRDGVYAYIGRRAQIQARKRFLGLEGEEHDTTMPTYLVYPRDFRDNLTTETKDVYLRQNIPNPQAAHYYDTGFTGTVPQDIMKVLGLSEADWDERIRLLSGTKRDRTVLGLEGSENERHQIVNTIEYNVKNERTAAGLYNDENDELRPYAEPTSPKDRLQFALVQQALHRHYYVKEMEALQGAETRVAMTATSLQSGELRLSTRLDDTQKQQLTEFFDHDNIGQRLLSGAKQIKISDPSDPYPDEAVFEIPLAGTDGVIVKSVVTDKQQGPLDEFEALLLLQKVGVDSPKPLGRIFTDGQHGFVIMEKLPGISGRAIQQYFDENNISEEDQQGILAYTKDKMQEIAETIRRDTGLDKPWRLKDFMLVFETLPTTVDRMLPIDFERANVFDPQHPQSIEI